MVYIYEVIIDESFLEIFMSDILLVQIQQTDHRPKSEYFEIRDESVESQDFSISVLNGDSLQLRASDVRYTASSFLKNKITTIGEELGIDYGGAVVAIDKYPRERFGGGAQKINNQNYSRYNNLLRRYEIECLPENWKYDSVILLAPGSDTIVLSTLKFGCYGLEGFSSSSIVFTDRLVLSVKSLLGEVNGISLTNQDVEVQSRHGVLYHQMSFERISLQSVLLHSALKGSKSVDIC